MHISCPHLTSLTGLTRCLLNAPQIDIGFGQGSGSTIILFEKVDRQGSLPKKNTSPRWAKKFKITVFFG